MTSRGAERGPVLIAYDGSEDAADAIACAGRLLPPRRALVAHSYVGLSRFLSAREDRPLAEAVKELRADDAAEAERVAAEGAQLAIGAGLEAQPLAVEQAGSAWRTLMATADEHGAAAIVAGARGRSAIASALLGSVSTGLVHHSEIPVLIVPAKCDPGLMNGPSLLCYDASPGSKQAIEAAGDLLVSKTALVLHVWESWLAHAPTYLPLVGGAVGGMARELDEIAEAQSDELARAGVEKAADAGFDPIPLSEESSRVVWRQLLDVADEREASVIVLGSRGLSGLSAVLGSVSHGVIHHAQRPVLLVPTAEPGA